MVQLIGSLGAMVGLATSGFRGPTIVGLALVAGGLAAVVDSGTGRRTGI